MSELVDLSKLPAPDVLEVLNYEELLSQEKKNLYLFIQKVSKNSGEKDCN